MHGAQKLAHMKEKNEFRFLVKQNLSASELEPIHGLFIEIIKNKDSQPFRNLHLLVMESPIVQQLLSVAVERTPLLFSPVQNLLTAPEVAQMLDVSIRTLATWRKTGVLPAEIWKGKSYYRPSTIHASLSANKYEPVREMKNSSPKPKKEKRKLGNKSGV